MISDTCSSSKRVVIIYNIKSLSVYACSCHSLVSSCPGASCNCRPGRSLNYTVIRHLMVMPPCPHDTPSYATFIRGPLQNLCGHAQCMTSLQVFHLLRLRDMESEPTKTQIQKETNQDSKRQGDTVFSPPKNETLAVAAQLVARMGMALLQGNDAWPKGRNEAVYWGNQSQWG